LITGGLNLRLHHVGILVSDIESAAHDYVGTLGYEICSAIIHDPRQGAYVQFLALRSETTLIELVSPDGPGSFLQNSLKRAPGINHLCYSTPSIDETLQFMSSQGAMILHEPVPAVAFLEKRIAWVMDRNYTLIELVEAPVTLA